MKIRGIKAVVFDLGDTLIPFGTRQFDRIWERLYHFLRERLPALDRSRMMKAYTRAQQEQLRVNQPALLESNFEERIHNFLLYLDDKCLQDHYLEQVLECYHDAFLEVVEEPEYLCSFLEKIRSRFKTGLISNFPYGPPIRGAIEKLKIEPYLDSIVISAEFGRVKPHPEIFMHCLSELELKPQEAIFVGNSWVEDIIGAKNAGIHAAYIVQWSGETGPSDEDVPMLKHLTELEEILE